MGRPYVLRYILYLGLKIFIPSFQNHPFFLIANLNLIGLIFFEPHLFLFSHT
jgi:hypothetical protein